MPQPTVQMTFEESVPVDDALPVQDEPAAEPAQDAPKIRGIYETQESVEAEPVVEDAVEVEPIGSKDDVVENANPVAVSVFNFENNTVRTVAAENGEVWFVAKDVALALGYQNTKEAVNRHVHDGDAQTAPIQDSMNRTQHAKIINESGLYALIFGSELETSKRFKKWVTSEVLPTIRKTGKYEAPKVEPRQDDSLLEKIKTTGEIVNATMSLLQSLGIEGNQAALGANKVASKMNATRPQ